MEQHPEQERRRPEAIPERRDHTPKGRIRRILFEHRGLGMAMILAVVVAAGLFVATSAWAVNERLTRRVTEATFHQDSRTLEFVRRQEAERVRAVEERERALAAREEELAPAGRPYLVVSLAERRVLLIQAGDTLWRAPVAVGSGATLVVGGRTKRFETPRGRMSITKKERDPIWVPPDWHYIRYARDRGMQIVNMSSASPNALAGYPAGQIPVRGNTVIIPPYGSPQRQVRGTLGAAKLEMYDGYYFHGTDNESSVGTAASAGCLRMRRADILWMYDNIAIGTPVYIY
jgi:lipoprotein-anchoring transpeptidase ErfK/SrfK